jgi:hypothetical protein
VLACAACVPEIPRDGPPSAVEAEFDPTAEPSPRIPKPTDLVYDVETARLAIDLEPDDSPAQQDLVGYLDSLDGWPASMPGEAVFLGPVDNATVTAATVRVFDITDIDSPEPVGDALRFLEDRTELRVHPGRLPSWQPGRRYAIAVLGGSHGVAGAGGEAVVPSPVFWFFRSASPLAVCEDDEALAGCRSVTDLIADEDVADLEEIRRDNAEVFDALEAAGVPRADVALAWSFRTSSRTVVPFDPSTDDVHFPNDYYLAEDETHLEVPAPDGSTFAARAFLDRLNALDGYSLTGPGWMRFVGPFDGSGRNLTPTALLFMNADDDQDLPLVQRGWDAFRNEVVLAPYRTLRSHTRYAAIATDYLEDVNGEEIICSHVWAILKSHNPAADEDGHSLLDGVSDEDARDLEEARQEYGELFDTLENKLSYPREKVQVGVVFTTRSVLEDMQELRQRPSEEALPTEAVAPDGVRDPEDVVPAGLPHDNLGGVLEGTVPGLELVDPATREIDFGPGTVVELPFVITLPAAPPAGRDAAPLVLFQHDLRGSRRDVFVVADGLAAAGYAAVAIDLVGHGARGVCLEDHDCDAGTCRNGSCDGGGLRIDGDGLPRNARDVFVPVSRPFAVGDALRQQAVDLVAVVRSLRAVDGPGSLAGVRIDAQDVSFLGVGFGAMAGAIFVAVDPAVHVVVLHGAGGNLRQLVDGSTEFAGALDSWLEDDLGLAPEREAHRFFRYAWSWAADPGDPAVWAHHLIDAPLPDPDGEGVMAPRALLVQVPLEDDVIPFEAQRFFYLSAGVEVYPVEFAGAGHGFFLDPDDPDAAAARAQAVGFIASGGATVPPVGG